MDRRVGKGEVAAGPIPAYIAGVVVVPGVTGFDGVGEALVACPGPRAPGKTLGKITIANNNLALAA